MSWKTIPDTDGKYQAHPEGRVRPAPRPSKSWGGIPLTRPELEGHADKGGYIRVHLAWKGAKARPRLLHQLILETFTGPRPEGAETRHLDGNPRNNRIDNLKWGTPEENTADRVRHRKERTAKAVADFREKYPHL